MIAIIDYGMGNLASVIKALKHLSLPAQITQSTEEIKKASHIILPGVGSFQHGMKNLDELNLIKLLHTEVIRKKKPFLGICLGMQLIMERGSEPIDCKGLSWVKGSVNKINNKREPIPHLGWNKIYSPNKRSVDDNINNNFYFIHSYHVTLEDVMDEISLVDYEFPMIASFKKDNIFATQFHPEKSQEAGLTLLKNFFYNYA